MCLSFILVNDSSARKYGSLITNITLMLKNAFLDYGSISTELCSMLTEMWTLYCQCTSEIKIKLSEYTISTGLIKEINKFICSIIESMYKNICNNYRHYVNFLQRLKILLLLLSTNVSVSFCLQWPHGLMFLKT